MWPRSLARQTYIPKESLRIKQSINHRYSYSPAHSTNALNAFLVLCRRPSPHALLFFALGIKFRFAEVAALDLVPKALGCWSRPLFPEVDAPWEKSWNPPLKSKSSSSNSTSGVVGGVDPFGNYVQR